MNLTQGALVLEWHVLLHITWVTFQLWVQEEVGCWHPHMPISVSITTPWSICYLWECWGEFFQPSLEVLGEVGIFSYSIGSNSYVQGLTERITGQFRLLILVVPCWMEPLLLFVLSLVKHVLPWWPMIKFCCGCFSRLVIRGSAIIAFDHFIAQRHVLQDQWFSFPIYQAVAW